ncbi:MAG: hypothetical protein CMP54_01865 [Flavobacteriales bacterium]|nr:hypothetical protein [Flavobacteriales bacterium]
MIINTTYLDKEKKKIINNIVGDSISWTRLFKGEMRGSGRMIIDEYSVGFKNKLNNINSLLYGNIEIREKGLIIRIPIKHYETISWLIGYHQLAIFKSKNFSIHSAGEFIKFRIDSNYTLNNKFIRQIIKKKNSNVKTFKY